MNTEKFALAHVVHRVHRKHLEEDERWAAVSPARPSASSMAEKLLVEHGRHEAYHFYSEVVLIVSPDSRFESSYIISAGLARAERCPRVFSLRETCSGAKVLTYVNKQILGNEKHSGNTFQTSRSMLSPCKLGND